MRHTLPLLCSLSLLLAASTLAAQPREEDGAHTYVRGSTSVFASGSFGRFLLSSSPDAASLSTNTYGALVIDVTVRMVHQTGLTVEPRLGFSVARVDTGSASLAVQLRPGVGLGYAVTIGNNFAFTPMVVYQMSMLASGSKYLAHTVSGELPFSTFVGRYGVVELYGMLGATTGANVSEPVLSYGMGLRLGVRL